MSRIFSTAYLKKILERRQHPRVTLEGQAAIFHEHDYFFADIINVSVGGICLACGFQWSLEHSLYVSFILPEAQDILRPKARIVRNHFWQSRLNWGMEFTELDSDDKTQLEIFIRNLETR